ncbi:MAG TPA: hypothetical protein VF753_11540, partial [Terriglobales bacterium]
SFTYPKNYDIKEGDLEGNDWRLGYIGDIPMDFVAPGGMWVATVKMPKDAYPNTDLGIAYFTVAVNTKLRRADCEKFPDNLGGTRNPLAKKISRVAFHGIEQADGGAGHIFSGNYYHGFANGICYELGIGMATAGCGAVDGITCVKSKEIFTVLDEILGSVKIKKPSPAK